MPPALEQEGLLPRAAAPAARRALSTPLQVCRLVARARSVQRPRRAAALVLAAVVLLSVTAAGSAGLLHGAAHSVLRTVYYNTWDPSGVLNGRYGGNWLKLQAFNLSQYDAVVLVDSDTAVVGDLSPLFSLPIEFAASWDQPKLFGKWGPRLTGINTGLLLVRPCPAMLDHMLSLLDSHPKLRFTYATAEQDFLNWYFRFTGMMLPIEYNTMASDSLDGNVTLGGRSPVVVHFTRNKPFHGPVPGKPGHQFLCAPHELG
ncbi:glycosyltransferase family 8 [Micractinium conductrix]|uniref:Hexosyltransferase n=1 Tax=Micractinium conductrix TaxID=554055 RepID=A0A2P6UZ24_9CHLO|nr:glycosyltransferase family 8 [Micractinium conductrix]|eukprot:PSC67076.1 glycosyltransferase family 8 [Micractinium conductrix]